MSLPLPVDVLDPSHDRARGGSVRTRLRHAAAILVLAALAAACDVGESAAFKTYKSFVNAIVRGDCDTLYALAEREAVGFVDNQCRRRSITIMDKTIDLGSIASNVASIRPNSTPFNDPISMERTIESETRSSDKKTVDLVVLEKSFLRRGNVREPTWLRRHAVTLQSRDGQWKLTRFEETILRKYEEGEAAREEAAGKKKK